MKLSTLILAAGVMIFAACGGTYRATDSTTFVVHDGARTAFVTQYPTATNVVWSSYDQVVVPIDWELTGWTLMDADDYVVKFNMDNQDYYAWYDSDGNWVGTAYVVTDFTTLPAPVNSLINTKYSGYTITSVNREFQTDRMAYEVELKGPTTKVKMLVDGNGTIIKQKTKAL